MIWKAAIRSWLLLLWDALETSRVLAVGQDRITARDSHQMHNVRTRRKSPQESLDWWQPQRGSCDWAGWPTPRSKYPLDCTELSWVFVPRKGLENTCTRVASTPLWKEQNELILPPFLVHEKSKREERRQARITCKMEHQPLGSQEFRKAFFWNKEVWGMCACFS